MPRILKILLLIFLVVTLSACSSDVIMKTPTNFESESFSDMDKDGVPDNVDNCPDISNTDQFDYDRDGLGDICDDYSVLDFFISNLPIVIIDTFGIEIPDEPKIVSNIKIIHRDKYDYNYITDKPAYDTAAGIELRGSRSMIFDKKSFGFETWNGESVDQELPLLGFPTEEDWILYGPYADKTLLKNHIAYLISNQIGRYASRTKFVELFLNDTGGEFSEDLYHGVYVFMEKIKRDADRVDVAKLTPLHTSQSDISGGYILKIDKLDEENDYYFTTSANTRIIVDYPKPLDITDAQKNWIEVYMNEFEAVMASDDFADPVNGYAKYIDVDTFVDYFLMNEYFRNVDAFRISTFMHKDRNGKLKMGPIWDFNLSMGGTDHLDGPLTTGWNTDVLPIDGALPMPFWWHRLRTDENFNARVRARWNELKTGAFSLNNVHSIIDEGVALLDEAKDRNFARWPVLGIYVYHNPFPIPKTYEEEIIAIKTWFQGRFEWIDSNLDTLNIIP